MVTQINIMRGMIKKKLKKKGSMGIHMNRKGNGKGNVTFEK